MLTSELFEGITRHIIDAIEAGAGDFAMPWHRWGEGAAQPVNAISGRSYRGINTLLLWAAAEVDGRSSGRWATYRQWTEAGAQVRKGERAAAVVFWKPAANDGSSQCDDVDTGNSHQRFISRVYHVFNEDQVAGAEPGRTRLATSPAERIAAADSFIAATGANIRHGGDRAAYVPGIDEIWLPRFEQFRDAQSYYATLAHETVHWSGSKHRLDRDLTGRFGNDAYAMEELVAELGSAFIAGHLGISVEPRPDHAAYLSSWLRVLRNDPRAILTASAKAQQAVDYLIAPSAAQREPCSPGDASCFDPGNCGIEGPASGRMARAAGAILSTTRFATNDGDHTHSMPSLRARS